jgi:L-aminopeptidase/D-esterase-like protein
VKKILLVGLIVVAVGLAAGFAVPTLAQSPLERNSGTADQETWQAMHEACQEGDWDAGAEAAQEVHEGLGYASCHGYGYPASEEGNAGSQGGMMGGGMMGGRWGGMM